jgi:hypothetical protein
MESRICQTENPPRGQQKRKPKTSRKPEASGKLDAADFGQAKMGWYQEQAEHVNGTTLLYDKREINQLAFPLCCFLNNIVHIDLAIDVIRSEHNDPAAIVDILLR